MKSIEKIFGIGIDNANYFNCALTHSSYTQETGASPAENYERLEFLGDAVLKLCVSDILYKKYPDYNEGELTEIRSIVISDSKLSEIARELGLAELVNLGKDARKQGLRKLESINACTFEALLGAYYLDRKFTELLEFLQKKFMPVIEEINKHPKIYNAKAVLQEYTQGLTKQTPVYEVVKESGPAHNKTFEIQVSFEGKILGRCEGKTKKEAEQKCAYEACKKLGVIS